MYKLEEIILAAVMMFIFKEGSRNRMNEDRAEEQFRKNYKSLFGLKLPHLDTVSDVMKKLGCEHLETLRHHVVTYLLEKRTLHKFRLLDIYFTIAIDGSGVYHYDYEPYEGCPYKVSKRGKKTWYQNVLEAKIVCPNGFCISIATEWLKNEDGHIKQDCEQKALKRLLKKLKEDYPRLPICILLDGLFASEPVMAQIKDMAWQYIIVWKDGKLKSVWEQLGEFRLAGSIERIEKEQIHDHKSKTQHLFEFGPQALQHKNQEFYYISQVSEKTDLNKPEDIEKNRFVFISSIPVNKTNIMKLTQGGRLRWKIENEGFNTQKNQGMNLHHKYVRSDFTGIRNYYMCMQIAHIIEQLYVLCKNKVMHGWKTIKGMWLHLWANMLCVPIQWPDVEPKTKLNFRY